MKNIILPFALFFVLIACKDQNTDTARSEVAGEAEASKANTPTIEGVWEMESQYTYDGEDIIDTTYYKEGYRQMKIYTPEKIMWSRQVPLDSTQWFGYGSYKVEDGQLVETIEYGSTAMMKALDTIRVFSFELMIDENTFSQITVDEELGRISSENYKRIE